MGGGDVEIPPGQSEHTCAVDAVREIDAPLGSVRVRVLEDVDELKRFAEVTRASPQARRERGEAFGFEKEELGQHLADDPGDDVAVVAQLAQRGQPQVAAKVAALHEPRHSRDGAQQVLPQYPARECLDFPVRIHHRGGLAQQLEVSRVRHRGVGQPALGCCLLTAPRFEEAGEIV